LGVSKLPLEVDKVLAELGFTAPKLVEGRASIADVFRKQRCGIYVLHFADDAYYVGQAVDVVRRYAQHRQTHQDIRQISFRLVARRNLNAEERVIVKRLEDKGVRLRNIQLVNFSYGETDFDLVMPPSVQQRWLEDLTFNDMDGTRPVDEQLRSRYARKYERFQQLPYASEVIQVLRHYVQTCIPAVKRTEMSFWMCSCLPYKDVRARINVGWQTTFDVVEFNGSIFYKLYTSRAMAEEIFEIPLETVNRDYGMTISDFEEHPDLFIEIYESDLTKGAQDQVFVIVERAENALLLLKDDYMLTAERVFNLGLMQKGPTPWAPNHCLDLADKLLCMNIKRRPHPPSPSPSRGGEKQPVAELAT
jgi:hypothetical protein